MKNVEADMKAWVIAILAIGAFAPSLSAQWPSSPTSGAPKTPDGKPNLSALAPRMPDGKPDLSGLWENAPLGVGQRGAPPAPSPGQPPLATFFDIGAGFKEGLPFRPWAAELLKQRRADNDKDNPDAHCLPMGLLQFHEHPQPRKIVQAKDVIVIIYEANYGLRQIFLDGRALPSNDPQPWWYGYSVGKWDGDTLVVETTGLRDDGWLDIWGSPLTDQAKITERFRRPNYGTLQIDVTIDDPKAYTMPFTVRFNQRLTPDTELIEFICNENERSASHLLGKDSASAQASFRLDPKVFDGYVGRYQMAPGRFITFTRQDNRFFAEMIPGQPPFEIFAASAREFFLQAFDARFTFEVDARGRATAVIMHTDSDQRAPRVQ
jgi:hypothetical protein